MWLSKEIIDDKKNIISSIVSENKIMERFFNTMGSMHGKDVLLIRLARSLNKACLGNRHFILHVTDGLLDLLHP